MRWQLTQKTVSSLTVKLVLGWIHDHKETFSTLTLHVSIFSEIWIQSKLQVSCQTKMLSVEGSRGIDAKVTE